MRRYILFPLLLMALSEHANCSPELTHLIDSPTAGLLDKGRYGIAMRLYNDGGVLFRLNAGTLKRLSIGLSFGAEEIIGDKDIVWQPRVEVALHYRLIEENSALPALALGYNTQGFGSYRQGSYDIPSKGAYTVLSKNFISYLGQFGIHAGANLCREKGRDDFSGWLGTDKSINEEISVLAEYDLALNNNLGSGLREGYLNAGAHFSISTELHLGLYLKNLLRHGPRFGHSSREITVLYQETF